MDAQTDDKSKTKDLHEPSRFTWIKTKQFLLIAYSQNGKLVESRLHYKTIKTSQQIACFLVPYWYQIKGSAALLFHGAHMVRNRLNWPSAVHMQISESKKGACMKKGLGPKADTTMPLASQKT